MNSVNPIRRNNYKFVNFLGSIVWLILAIASAFVLMAMIAVVFSGSPIIILPVIIIVPFMMSVKAITEAIKHGMATIWRAIRRIRIPDPSVSMDEACYQFGGTVKISITDLPANTKNLEVQLVNRLESFSKIDLLVRDIYLVNIQQDSTLANASSENREIFVLQLPPFMPSAKGQEGFRKHNTPFIPSYSHYTQTWVARVKIGVAGWIPLDEFYPISLC